jgi:sarcosine oxidase subunit alpha
MWPLQERLYEPLILVAAGPGGLATPDHYEQKLTRFATLVIGAGPAGSPQPARRRARARGSLFCDEDFRLGGR